MTDLKITTLCAEACGWYIGSLARKIVAYRVNDCAIIAGNDQGGESVYDPLHDDEQAMALVKKFRMSCGWDYEGLIWCETKDAEPLVVIRDAADLNRAICECVAKMQRAKRGPEETGVKPEKSA